MISVAAGAVKQNWQALEFACEDLRLAPMTLKPYDIVWNLWLEKDGKGCKVNFCKLFCDTPSTGVTAKLCKKQLNKADTRKAKTGLAKFIVASGRTNVEANEFNKPGMNSYLEDALLDATSNYIQQLQLYMIFIYVSNLLLLMLPTSQIGELWDMLVGPCERTESLWWWPSKSPMESWIQHDLTTSIAKAWFLQLIERANAWLTSVLPNNWLV